MFEHWRIIIRALPLAIARAVGAAKAFDAECTAVFVASCDRFAYLAEVKFGPDRARRFEAAWEIGRLFRKMARKETRAT